MQICRRKEVGTRLPVLRHQVGGFDLAASWMGWKNVFHCEINEFGNTVLSYWFPKAEHYDDITKTDFTKWRGKIDVLSGGFPCQPFSVAGRRKGADDDRYLWPEMLRAIQEIRPAWIIGENVAGITSMVQSGKEVTVAAGFSLFGETDTQTLLRQESVLETVCGDLERAGYSVQPFIIPACAVGAPHRRDRIWFIAGTNDGFASDTGYERCRCWKHNWKKRHFYSDVRWWPAKNQPERNEWQCRTGENGRTVADTEKQPGKRMQSDKSDFGCERKRESGGESCSLDTGANDIRFDSERWEKDGFFDCSDEKAENIGKQQPSGSFLPDWRDFPTISPVCRRNDGLPFTVDDLAVSFSKWRAESIKAYGNAVVPALVYRIFQFIENTYR